MGPGVNGVTGTIAQQVVDLVFVLESGRAITRLLHMAETYVRGGLLHPGRVI